MKKILLPGIIAGIATFVLGMAVSYLFMLIPTVTADYQNTAIMRPWKDPLMMLFLLYPFVEGILFAWAWNKSKELFHGSDLKRGMNFGLAIWMITTIPGMLVSYASFQLSLLTIVSWLIGGLICTIADGLIFVKMNK